MTKIDDRTAHLNEVKAKLFVRIDEAFEAYNNGCISEGQIPAHVVEAFNAWFHKDWSK